MWISHALAATALLGIMLLCAKKASLMGLSAVVILFWVFVGAAVCMGGHLVATRESPKVGWLPLGLLSATAVCSYLGNMAYFKALAAAPNPGYPVAIEGCKAVVVLLGSWLLFNSGMSATKVAGIILCLVGVLLVTR